MLLLLASLFASCTRTRLEQLITQTPPVPKCPVLAWNTAAQNDYQRDARYLAELFQAYFPDREDTKLGEAFVRRSQTFENAAAQVREDTEWRNLLRYYLASFQDGHTRARFPWYNEGAPYYRLSLLRDSSGAFVVRGIDSSFNQAALGSRLKSVNGVPIAQVLAKARQLHPGENVYYKDDLFRRYAYAPQQWNALGIDTAEERALRLVLQPIGGQPVHGVLKPRPPEQLRSVKADSLRFPFAQRQPTAFFTQFLPEVRTGYLQMNTSLDWAAMRSELGNYIAWPLRPFAKAYLRKRQRAIGAEDFGQVVADFFRRAHRDSLKSIVLDLRNNPGGDERLGLQFLYYLTEREDLMMTRTHYRFDDFLRRVVKGDYRRYRSAYAKTQGQPPAEDAWVSLEDEVLLTNSWRALLAGESGLYLDPSVPKFTGDVVVLTSPRTFSAASILAATLQDNGLATLVGTPTGNRPAGPTGASLVKLPYTKTIVSFSYVYLDRPDPSQQHLDAVYPDVFAPQTLNDYRRGGDATLEAALRVHYLRE